VTDIVHNSRVTKIRAILLNGAVLTAKNRVRNSTGELTSSVRTRGAKVRAAAIVSIRRKVLCCIRLPWTTRVAGVGLEKRSKDGLPYQLHGGVSEILAEWKESSGKPRFPRDRALNIRAFAETEPGNRNSPALRP
jgi:hypothetical protein